MPDAEYLINLELYPGEERKHKSHPPAVFYWQIHLQLHHQKDLQDIQDQLVIQDQWDILVYLIKFIGHILNQLDHKLIQY